MDIYYRFFPLEQPEPLWPGSSEGEHHYHLDCALAGAFSRNIFILTDYDFNYTFLSSVEGSAGDPWLHYDMEGFMAYSAIRNQVEWDGNKYVRYIPTFYEFRGVEKWGGILAINWPFPDPYDYNACPYEELD